MNISNSKYKLDDPLLIKFFRDRGRALMKSVIKDLDIICKYHNVIHESKNLINAQVEFSTVNKNVPTEEDLSVFASQFKQTEIENFISKYYLNEAALFFIYNKDKEKFSPLSASKLIDWSDQLIQKYCDHWDWRKLCKNTSIIWNDERIEFFKDRISFDSLSFNMNLRISASTLYKYEDNWCWEAISGHPNLIISLRNEIFNHSRTVWQSMTDEKRLIGIENLNEYYYDEMKPLAMNGNILNQSIKPSISTNPSIKWTRELISKYENRIDLWSVVLYADIDSNSVIEYSTYLDENRFFNTEFTRSSDWRDEHPVYRSGWENFVRNQKTRINLNLLQWLHEHNINVISYDGTARTGHSQIITKKRTSELILPANLDIDFIDFYQNYNLLPRHIFSDYAIDLSIFERIIKPAFLADSPWMIILLLKESEMYVRSKSL